MPVPARVATPTAWRRFINPPEVHRASREGGVMRGVELAGAVLLGAAVVVPVEVVGNTVAVTLRLPNVVSEAYRNTWATQQVGPNIKVLTSALIPVAAATLPALVAVASALCGIGYGAYAGMQYGALNAVRPAFGHIEHVWKWGGSDALAFFTREMRAPLKPGQEPFDIRILEAGKGLVGGVASAAVEALFAGAIGVCRIPQALLRVWTGLVPKIAGDSGPFGLAVGILGTAAVPVAAALCPVAATFFGLGEGAVKGYQGGVAAALEKAVSRVGDFWRWSGKLASGHFEDLDA